jgi:dCMP deaminase|tara:strand:+ start:1513 stop:1956 length:444 start_codon:yes stop_codon:yes gene_type:complete
MNKWDQRFLEMAAKISEWSKDPSRKIGCIAVNNDRKILATGYNGFPSKIEDHEYRYNDRETKYQYVIHAEMNCIYNAAVNGVSLLGSTFYIHGLPVCHECAKGIIQVGVTRVVAHSAGTPEKWADSNILTMELFKEAGVEYEFNEIH